MKRKNRKGKRSFRTSPPKEREEIENEHDDPKEKSKEHGVIKGKAPP